MTVAMSIGFSIAQIAQLTYAGGKYASRACSTISDMESRRAVASARLTQTAAGPMVGGDRPGRRRERGWMVRPHINSTGH
jgi:hypothetical protein